MRSGPRWDLILAIWRAAAAGLMVALALGYAFGLVLPHLIGTLQAGYVELPDYALLILRWGHFPLPLLPLLLLAALLIFGLVLLLQLRTPLRWAALAIIVAMVIAVMMLAMHGLLQITQLLATPG